MFENTACQRATALSAWPLSRATRVGLLWSVTLIFMPTQPRAAVASVQANARTKCQPPLPAWFRTRNSSDTDRRFSRPRQIPSTRWRSSGWTTSIHLWPRYRRTVAPSSCSTIRGFDDGAGGVGRPDDLAAGSISAEPVAGDSQAAVIGRIALRGRSPPPSARKGTDHGANLQQTRRPAKAVSRQWATNRTVATPRMPISTGPARRPGPRPACLPPDRKRESDSRP